MSHILKISTIIMMLCLSACVPVNQGGQTKQQENVHHKLAMAYLQGNNPTMALKESLVAVKQDPNNSSIQFTLALAYQQKKAHSLAEKHYLKALVLSNNDPRYQNNLASLYLDMEKWDKAIDYFDQASMNLLFANAHVAVAGKAYAYFKKMDYPTALNYYREALALAPRYAQAYFHQSEVYRALGDVDQEKVSLERAVDIAPRFFQARYQLAVLLLQQESPEEAAEQLKIILEFSPTSELGYKARGILKSLPDS
ncbi:MAG: tetratricopeptide repeat protein [Desulfuromusa sp.]|nr:tetratricopeptide repeat protein [Desulfuromusa sp.]